MGLLDFIRRLFGGAEGASEPSSGGRFGIEDLARRTGFERSILGRLAESVERDGSTFLAMIDLDGLRMHVPHVANDLPTIDAYGEGDVTLIATTVARPGNAEEVAAAP